MINYIGARIHRGITYYSPDGSISYGQDPYLAQGLQVKDLPTRWAYSPSGAVYSFSPPEPVASDWRNLENLLAEIDLDRLGGTVKPVAPAFVAKPGYHYRPGKMDSVDYWTLIAATRAAGQRLRLFPEPNLQIVELCSSDDPEAFAPSSVKLFGWCHPNGPTGDIFVRVGDDVSMAQAVVTVGHEIWHLNQGEEADHQSDAVEIACEDFGLAFARSLGY